MSLSARLRSETSEAHRAAEQSAVVKKLLTGTLPLFDYCRMMVNLHAIYQELERQLELHSDDRSIRSIDDARLARTAAIEQDLVQLLGERWSADMELEPATIAYRERLITIGKTQPVRLVAHAYVRYLGDLSGGQIISRAVRPILGTMADSALHFYQFGSKADMTALKASFRRGLDSIESDADAIVNEALLAFDSARILFEQLSSKIGAGALKAR